MGDNVNNATPNNATWSKLIIHQLYKHGVHHFCLAPGSRSTPLAVAVPEEGVPYSTHFDERGLGFYALGLAKGSGRPVAIIVTSGTAVGNLMPAVMEAWHDHVPLIVLTADRPPELRDCSANQTTDQVKIFSSFVHWQVDLPCPFPGGERYLASAMSYGVHLAVRHRCPTSQLHVPRTSLRLAGIIAKYASYKVLAPSSRRQRDSGDAGRRTQPP